MTAGVKTAVTYYHRERQRNKDRIVQLVREIEVLHAGIPEALTVVKGRQLAPILGGLASPPNVHAV